MAARNLGISRATIYSDSQLSIQQSNGKFEIKDEKMMKYVKALDKVKEGFTELNLELIPRAENIKADHLARLASALSDRSDPIVLGRELVSQLETLDDIIDQVPEVYWRYDVHKYLTTKELPSYNKKAKDIKRRALRFVMIDQILFKRSFSQPLLKCLGPDEGNYVLREIHEVCRFGIPPNLVSDNGRQFCGSKVRAWCQETKIEQVFTSVAYSQGNGQVEVINRTIVQALKTRLDTAIGKWVEELSTVLWSYRTTTRSGTGETPFSMVYGTEAVLPAEIGQESVRIMAYG
ncbi:uncharacterized protein [Henckelia pumila]|uniref:uncharacterized protein n=1 Tax=Henckelia pumila TaxID=405737 RepID=UPI003C6DE77B